MKYLVQYSRANLWPKRIATENAVISWFACALLSLPACRGHESARDSCARHILEHLQLAAGQPKSLAVRAYQMKLITRQYREFCFVCWKVFASLSPLLLALAELVPIELHTRVSFPLFDSVASTHFE